jgi:hypothetical protein
MCGIHPLTSTALERQAGGQGGASGRAGRGEREIGELRYAAEHGAQLGGSAPCTQGPSVVSSVHSIRSTAADTSASSADSGAGVGPATLAAAAPQYCLTRIGVP